MPSSCLPPPPVFEWNFSLTPHIYIEHVNFISSSEFAMQDSSYFIYLCTQYRVYTHCSSASSTGQNLYLHGKHTTSYYVTLTKFYFLCCSSLLPSVQRSNRALVLFRCQNLLGPHIKKQCIHESVFEC